jgi:hypothetical protein
MDLEKNFARRMTDALKFAVRKMTAGKIGWDKKHETRTYRFGLCSGCSVIGGGAAFAEDILSA